MRRGSLLAIRNRRDAAWGAASLMLAALEQVACNRRAAPGAQAADSAAPESRPHESAACVPTASPLHPRHALSSAARCAAGAFRKAVLKPQWLLAYQFGNGSQLAPTEQTRLVVPPSDRFWADPHVAHVDGEYHVFFEDLSHRTGRGRISTLRLGETGPIDESRVALACDGHLSYPFLFHFDGEWFMIPESLQAHRIDVYRAQEFPVGWKHYRTLLNHVRAMDTTMVEHSGRWWLFTTLSRLRGVSSLDHLYLFSADNPLSQTWEPHPSNPIASGAVGARAAGNIMERGDGLIRPSQDSRLAYGHRVELRRIDVMTRDEYRERPVGFLEPNVASGFVGLHTVSQVDDLTVVDLLRWRSRL